MRDKMTPILHSKEEMPILIDGSGPCKFTRCFYDGHPSIMIQAPSMDRPILITGPVLAGINGWLARLTVHDANQTVN